MYVNGLYSQYHMELLCWRNVDEAATLLESGEVRVLFGRTPTQTPTERNEKKTVRCKNSFAVVSFCLCGRAGIFGVV